MRTAIVTGTSSGIGHALALALLGRAWKVIGVARRDSEIEDERYEHHCVDLGDASSFDAFVETVVDPVLMGDAPVIALVNNAARVGALTRVRDLQMHALRDLHAINAAAPIALMARTVLRRRRGTALRIVNVSSGAAHTAIPGLGDYCATKAALRIAGQVLAAELEADGIEPREVAVMSYEPGLVETGMQQAGRGSDPSTFPSQAMFAGFRRDGLVVPPEAVVGPMVTFVESSDPEGHFRERRFGQP